MKKITLICSFLFFGFSLSNAQLINTFAGSTTPGSANGTGVAASFSGPYGITSDNNGHVFVSDQNNNMIREITLSTGAVTTLAGSVTSGHADGIGAAASFNFPNGLAVVGDSLFVVDGGNNEIRLIRISTGVVTTFAGSYLTSGFSNGTAPSATFNQPFGIVSDGIGHLYITEQGNNAIRQINLPSTIVSTLAGGTSGSTDGTGISASFNSPGGITIDGSSNLYVAEAGNNEIREINTVSASVTTLAGSTINTGSTNGTGTSASFNTPVGIAIDPLGNLYVTEYNNSDIRKIVISNATVTTFSGFLAHGSADGIYSLATFYNPTGITIVNDTAYIADYTNNEIRQAVETTCPTINAFINGMGSVCSGLNDTVSGTVTGGITPYTYYWNAIQSVSDTVIVPNANSNFTYTLVAVDQAGCHSDTTVNNFNIDVPNSFSTYGNGTICTGGTAYIGEEGGAGSFTWTPSTGIISNSGSTIQVQPFSTITYTITETDGNGCILQDSAVEIVDAPPIVTITGNVNSGMVICSGIADTLHANVTGVGPFSFTWSFDGSGPEAVVFSPGDYNVQVTDNNGCNAFVDSTITGGNNPTISVSPNTSICMGNSASLQASGAPSYSWAPGSSLNFINDSTVTASPTGQTIYTVTGISSQGCKVQQYIGVDVNFPPSINISGALSICAGDSTFINTSGASTYTWAPSTGLSSTSSQSFNASPASSTTYTVTGTNSFGCTSSQMIGIYVNPLPIVNITGNTAICNGNTTTLTANASGGNAPYQYSWSPTGSTSAFITGINAGTYSCNVISSSGCMGTGTATVTVNPSPTIAVTGGTTICKGDSTNLSVTGALAYSWAPSLGLSSTNGGGLMAAPSSSIIYTVTGTDVNGCSNTQIVHITVTPLPNITISGSTSICLGNNTTLTASGASTYNWSGGPATAAYNVTPVSTTTYTVTGTDINGCVNSNSTQVIVNTPNPISANIFPGTTVCAGTQVVLYGSGGTAYSWNKGVNDGVAFRPLGSGKYIVSSLSNNCPISDSIQLTVNPLPIVVMTATPKDTVCEGSSVTLNATGATTYSWNNGITGGIAFSPAVSAEYAVTGTDANGCQSSAQQEITVVNLPSITASVNPQTVCQGSNITLTGNGGTTYTWSGGVINGTPFVPAGSGSYTVTGTNAAGCSNTDVIGVTVNTIPVLSDSAIPSTSVCQGTSVALLGKGASSYSWSGGIINGVLFVPSTTGTYYVTGYGANGCSAKDSITVKVNNKVITTPLTVNTTCGVNNGSVKILASNGTAPYTYNWSTTPVNTTDSIGSLSPGTYIVTVSDIYQCATYTSVNIATSTAPILSISTRSSSCGNATGSATVGVAGGTPPYTYSWSNGNTTNSDNNLTLGTYIITVDDANKCSSFISAAISNQNGPSISTSAINNVSCNGTATGSISINVSGGVLPYRYVWSNGATTQSISNLAAGPYQLTVTDADSCSALGNFTISQPSALTMSKTTTKANCGVSDGTAMVSVSGGISPYSYTWNNGRTSDSLATVPAGAYYITVSDRNGCKIDSAQVSVSNVNGPTVQIAISGSASCGSGGVTLTANVNGGTLPYSYLWSTTSTNNNISHIPAGNYNITVTDHLGCIGVADTSVYEVPPPVAPICMVTVDTATGKNMIIWDKIKTSDIAYYNLYKESTQAGVYQKIAKVPYDSNSEYIDTLSNPQTRSWRYELSQVDSCGNESSLSPAHKTMHLTVNQGIAGSGTVNLIWDNYEGMTFYTYYVYRDTLSTGLTLIDSIPNNIFTYTDNHVPKSTRLYYRIEVVNPDPCTPHRKKPMTINYNASKSNTGNFTFNTVGIADIGADKNQMTVYPNPTTGIVKVTLSTAKGSKALTMTVVNELGQEVITSQYSNVAATFTKEIDLSTLAKGVYFIKLTTDNTTLFNKVVFQ